MKTRLQQITTLVYLALILLTTPVMAQIRVLNPDPSRRMIEEPSTIHKSTSRSVGDSENMTLIGRHGAGYCLGMAHGNDHAYIARGSIIDVHSLDDDGRLQDLVGSITLPDLIFLMAYRDGLLYVANNHTGLKILDISDPGLPVVVGSLELPGKAANITFYGNFIAVGMFGDGVYMVDVEDPTSPSRVVGIDTNMWVRETAVYDHYLLVADFLRGVRIYDIENMITPRLVATFLDDDLPQGVTVLNQYAYLSGYSGITILDMTDPDVPIAVNHISSDVPIGTIRIDGQVLYAGIVPGGVRAYDLQDPVNPIDPVLVSFDSGKYPTHLEMIKQTLYAPSEAYGVVILDCAEPLIPIIKDRIPTSGHLRAVEVRDDLLVMAGFDSGLMTFYISNPALPQQIGVWEPDQDTHDIYFSGTTAMVAADHEGVAMIDLTNPASPEDIGWFHDGSFLQVLGVTGQGPLGYVAHYGQIGFKILDISEPSNPHLLGEIMGIPPTKVVVRDHYAFLAGDNIMVADVSDPAAPVIVDVEPTQFKVEDIAMDGDLLYAVTASWGATRFYICDVSNPEAVTTLATMIDYGTTYRLAFEHPYVYLANDERGVVIIDVSNPHQPEEVGSYQTGGFANCVAVRDGTVYVGASGTGLWILSNDLITTPVELTDLTVARQGNSCRVGWTVHSAQEVSSYRLSRVGSSGGAEVVSTVPAHGAGEYKIVDSRAPLTEVTYLLDALDGDNGVERIGTVVAPPAEAMSAALGCHPNPLNPATVVSYTAPEGGAVQVDVYDPRGALVRSLVNEVVAAGDHTVTWDGRDGAGRRVAAGLYLARLKTNNYVRTTKMVVVE